MEEPSSRRQDRVDEAILTPAAADLVDEYVHQVKRRIIGEAARIQSEDVGSVVRLQAVQSAISRDAPARTSIRYAFRWMAVALVVAAGVGFVAALMATWERQGSSSGSLGMWSSVLAGVSSGFALSVAFAAARAARSFGRQNAVRASREFLISFEELESIARKSVIDSVDREEFVGLSRVLSLLERIDYWNSEDVRIFRDLLTLRNRLVHENVRSLTAEEITYGVHQARRLSELLKAPRGSFIKVSRSAVNYQEEVASAVRRTGFDQVVQVREDRGVDILVDTPMGSVAIIIKYRPGRTLRVNDVLDAVARVPVSHQFGIVFVTNADLGDDVKDFNAKVRTSPVEAVHWNGPEQDGILARALARSAR